MSGCDMRGALITQKEHEDLNRLFKEFDGDGNGDIDAEELKLLTEKLKIMATPADIKIMMEQLDENGSGTIDCNELLELIDKTLAETYTEEEIEESFKSISDSDTTDNGEINALKLSKAMNLASIYISEEDVTALVTEVDMDGDGLIDFREFRDTVLGF